MGRPPRADVADVVLQLEVDDPAPAYVQLERRVRLAVADGTLQPGDRLPSVRLLAGRLGLAPNTVGRAYAELAREGVIVARAGGGSEVAPRESLDRTALARSRQERLRTLARQAAVRGLALVEDLLLLVGVGQRRTHAAARARAARVDVELDAPQVLDRRRQHRKV